MNTTPINSDISISIVQSLRTLMGGPSDPEMAMKMRDVVTEKLDPIMAKISERSTVHRWLNDKGIPIQENGKPLCLLRRLAIALEVHDE